MKILYVAGSMEPRDGGAVQVVLGLTKALAKNNIETSIFAPVPDLTKNVLAGSNVQIRFFKKPFFSKFFAGHALWSGYSPALARAVKEQAEQFDVIHTYGLWHYPHVVASKAAMAAGKPYVVTVQGELTPWALRRHSRRALDAQKEILSRAAAIQAVSAQEVINIKKFTDNPHVFMLPNGITPQEFSAPVSREWLYTSYPQLKHKKIILYLGRINEGKGLEELTRAFGTVAKREPDSYLLIVGPDDWGFSKHLNKILKKDGVVGKVIFTGMLSQEQKLTVLKSSNVFVLLSESEAFSVTILEALCCGLPVVISSECNFPEVATAGAGKIIARDAPQLAQTLLEMLADTHASNVMGQNGKHLIESGVYDYETIANKMIELYTTIT